MIISPEQDKEGLTAMDLVVPEIVSPEQDAKGLTKPKMEEKSFIVKHPNLYGMYGAAKAIAESMGKVGFPKYADPYEVKKLLELSPQDQKRQLLMDTLESVTMIAFGAKAPGKPRAIKPGVKPISKLGSKEWEKRFREITYKVTQAEKDAKIIPLTSKQQRLLEKINLPERKGWEEFSKARGYTKAEIEDYRKYLDLVDRGNELGLQERIASIQLDAFAKLKSIESRTALFEKMSQALKEAASKRKAQEILYTQERRKRFAKVAEVGKQVKGEKGFHAQLRELKGELPKVEYESIRGKIGQKDIDELFEIVKQGIPNTANQVTAQRGLAKIFGELGGVVPQPKEIELLRTVFPEKFIRTLLKKRGLFVRMKEGGYQLANIPRSVMASFDLSAPFRQGLFLSVTHPKRFAQSFFKMFRQFGSDKAFAAVQQSIEQKATFGLMQESGLALTQMGKSMTLREERFMSQWAEKLPFLVGRGVRASGRAYTGFLNKLRADVFEDLVLKAERLGRDPKNNMQLTKEIANMINIASGRGGLGSLERSAVTLNSLFFSPRLIASRIQLLNPVYYIKADPFVRKEALKNFFATTGAITTVLGLAKAGGAEVGTDPRSADFLKIKIDKTRIDIMGGVQQYMRAAAQIVSGKYISTTTGKLVTLGEGYRPLTRYEIGLRFAEQKLAPPASFVVALMKGKDIKGEDIKISKEVADRFKPMALNDIYEIYQENPELLPAGFLAFFGAGIQTYGPRKPSQKGIKGIGGIEK